MFYSYKGFSEVYSTASSYAKKTFHNLETRIKSSDFPCYYAKTTILKNSLYVAFIEKYEDQNDLFYQSKKAFEQFADIEKNPNPYHVFVLSMKVDTKNWEEDNALMWDFMHYLRQHDSEPWSSEIPTATDDANWSFSFMGMPWFFNLNSHNNTHRNSRNVTDTFSLILQRTDGFEKLLKAELDEDEREKQRFAIRKDIRGRIAAYDAQPVSPALAGEADNMEYLEWKQFHIPNLNTEKPQSKCPFKAFFSLASNN